MKKVAKKLHLWLALPFGIILTLVCFSGAVLAFEKEFTQWMYADLYRVKAVGDHRMPVGDIAAKVASTLPDEVKVTGITVYPDPARTYQVNLSKPHHASVFVDPYTGEVKGAYKRIPFFFTMFKLHRWLLGSRPDNGGIYWGKVIVGTATLAFVFVILSGILMWWPRTKKALRNSLKVTPAHGLRRFCYSFHVAVGVYTCLLLLCMTLTGLTWSFDWYRDGFHTVFGASSPQGNGHGPSASAGKQKGQDRKEAAETYAAWQTIYEELATRNPENRQISINANRTATVVLNRFGNTMGGDRYEFDPSTGKLTTFTPYADLPASAKIRGQIYAVHTGTWGGWLTRILYCLAALFASALPITGYYLWFRRVFPKKAHHA